MQGLPPIGAEIQQPGALPPIGAEVPEALPVYRQSDTSPNDVDPNTLGTFARHLGAQLNPLTAIHTIASAILHPVATTKAIGAAQGALFDKAKASYDQGDYLTAARHFVDYLIPLVGPAIDQSSDLFQAGKWAAGGGDALGLGLAIFGPQKIGELRASKATGTAAPRPAGALTAPDAVSNAFATERGIPLDAATATGSRTLRAAEKRVANSMGGEGTADRLIGAQRAALSRVGSQLATDAHPTPVTPEQAGTGVRETLRGVMGDMNASANQAYTTLRDLEESSPGDLSHTAPPGSPGYQRILGKLAAGAESGQAPSKAELIGMRQIEAELDATPFQRGKLVADDPGVSSATHYARGTANADVYHDILQAAPGTSDITGREMVASIRRTLDTGEWNNASRGALAVARERLRGSGSLTGPLLPSNTPLVGTLARVKFPVDLTASKKVLGPLYDRLKREAELVPLQGDKGRALVALDRLMAGPDQAPLSVVDAALGDLKSMARADIPELRTQGQGTAAAAVKTLDNAVRMVAAKAGPKVLQALEQGRAATTAKYQVADVFKELSAEPVKVFRQMTAPRDSGIALLRRVQEVAPERMPELARATLEDMLGLATERGGFDHADKLYADWHKLGPETKKALFGTPEQVQALDRFFLLAKRLSENPNPSGTAHTLSVMNFGSQPLTWGLAKLLYTPRGVKALTKLMDVQVKASAGRVGQAASQAAWIDLANAARGASVPLVLPKAAGPAPASNTR